MTLHHLCRTDLLWRSLHEPYELACIELMNVFTVRVGLIHTSYSNAGAVVYLAFRASVVLKAEAKPLLLGLRLITQQSRAPCSPSRRINMSNNTSVDTLIGADKKDEWSWFYSPALAHSGSITWSIQTSKQTLLFSVNWHSISKAMFLLKFTLILIRILIKI